jgi:hypothetical protein
MAGEIPIAPALGTGNAISALLDGPPLFYLAEDGASLQTALQSITSKICCGCAQ